MASPVSCRQFGALFPAAWLLYGYDSVTEAFIGHGKIAQRRGPALEQSGLTCSVRSRAAMLKFKVFGQMVGVERSSGVWFAYYLGNEGKYRPADFVIPDVVREAELAQYLADLFHESASPANPAVRQIEG